jgi:hypothetical protein
MGDGTIWNSNSFKEDGMRAVARRFFDEGGLTATFDHIKNLVVATLLVAAGTEAVRHVAVISSSILENAVFAGYVVAAAGSLLIFLNFVDGWRKLSKLQWHIALQAALSLAYLVFSVRLVQLIILFRSHTC